MEPDWILDGYLARGAVTMLSAREKVGKSTFTMAALRAIQTGAPFIGRATQKTGVIYLSEETGATLPEKLARFELEDDGIVWLTRDMTGGIADFRTIMAAVVDEAERRGAGLIVIDTLAYWAGLKDDDENSSGAMLAALRPILDAAARGLGTLLIHHNARQSGEYRGSTAIGGAVDVILSMTEDEAHGARRDLKARSRFGATPARLRVELRGNGFVGLGDPVAATLADEEAAVLDAIAAASAMLDAKTGEPLRVTREVIERMTGLSDLKVKRNLHSLISLGRVVQTGEGKRGDPYVYHLPSGAAQQEAMGERDSQASAPESAGLNGAADPTGAESEARSAARDRQALRLITENAAQPWTHRPKVTLSDIATDLGCDQAAAERTVQRLAARGDISRSGDAYQLASW